MKLTLLEKEIVNTFEKLVEINDITKEQAQKTISMLKNELNKDINEHKKEFTNLMISKLEEFIYNIERTC